MSFLREQNRIGLAIGIGLILLFSLLFFQYYGMWQERMGPPPVGKDYWTLYTKALAKDPIGIMFYLETGSSPFLRYFLFGLLWIWCAYLAGRLWPRHQHIVDRMFWSNFWWCIYATIFVMLAWTFGAVAQYYSWYACPAPGYCSPQPQGMMDKYTHFLSMGALAAMVLTVNFEDLLGLHGRTGRILELAIVLSFVFFLPMYWEYAELGDPARYTSTYIDAVTDFFVSTLGGIVNILVYNLVVPYEEAVGGYHQSFIASKEGPC